MTHVSVPDDLTSLRACERTVRDSVDPPETDWAKDWAKWPPYMPISPANMVEQRGIEHGPPVRAKRREEWRKCPGTGAARQLHEAGNIGVA
jgi:hypothetical protein